MLRFNGANIPLTEIIVTKERREQLWA